MALLIRTVSPRMRDALNSSTMVEFSIKDILGLEPQLLSYRLPVKVCVLRANLIALNLSEGSPRIGDGATGRRGAVH